MRLPKVEESAAAAATSLVWTDRRTLPLYGECPVTVMNSKTPSDHTSTAVPEYCLFSTISCATQHFRIDEQLDKGGTGVLTGATYAGVPHSSLSFFPFSTNSPSP